MTVYLSAWIPGTGVINSAAEVFKFPGGEVHLRNIIDLPKKHGVWIADVRGAELDDLMAAALLAEVAQSRHQRFVLMLPYLPAARADRGHPFAAGVYADLINRIGADEVITIDPHSNVMPGYVDHINILNGVDLISSAAARYSFDGVIAPDHGARTRALRVADYLGVDFYQAHKKRDFETGKLLSYVMDSTVPTSGQYLVVDDICDGGGTFKLLADASGLFRDQLSLWVTHGIFSGNANTLSAYYKEIFTTDSHPGSNRLGVATSISSTFHYMLRRMTGFK